MTVSNGDFVRINVRTTVVGQHAVNSFLFNVVSSAPKDNATFLSEASAAFVSLYTEIAGSMSTSVGVTDLTAYRVSWDTVLKKENILEVIGSTPCVVNGTDSGETMSSFVSFLINFSTGAVRTRLKKYLAGFTEFTRIAGSAWQSGTMTHVGNFATALLDGLALQVGEALVYGAFSKSANGFAPVVGAVLSSVEGVQRRRRIGRGS